MAGEAEPGFEVAPRPIAAQRPSGRRRLRAILVAGLVLAVPAIALVGTRISDRPPEDRAALLSPGPTTTPGPTNAPTPMPTPRPSSSPLPAVTIGTGDLPPGPLAIDVSGLRTVDPATGALGRTSGVRVEDDAVFGALDGDGWWCICFDRLPANASETATITVRHLDHDLREVERFDVATASSLSPADSQDFGVRFDVERSADGRIAYLAWVDRALDRWHVRVAVLDLASGAVIARSDVADLDSPLGSLTPTPPEPSAPPAETFSAGPSLRLAPGGATLLLTTVLDSFDPGTGEAKQSWSGWLLDVSSAGRAGPSLAARPVTDAVARAIADCRLVGWLAPDRLLNGCWVVAGDPSVTTTRLSVLDLAGDATPAGSFDSDSRELLSLELDLANGLAYAWEPLAHVLHRVELATGTVDTVRVDPTAAETVTVLPDRIVDARPPEWKAEASAYAPYGSPTLVPDPGGGRLYALGMRPGPGSGDESWRTGSTGIWVFDVATLRLLDHWPATAPYVSLAVSPDGRWLTAIGQGSVDTDGSPAAWPWSASIHDTTDGRLALQLGDLGDWQVHVP